MKKNSEKQTDTHSGTEPSALRAKPFSFDELEKILLYFSTSILEKNTEEETLWDLAKNCISHLHFVDCVIYLLDDEKQVLVQKAAYGPKNPKEQDILQPIEIPLGSGITGSVALSGRAEVIGDTSRDPRYIVDDEPRLSEIAVPIRINGKVLGIIDCEHPARDFFTPQHLRILTAIASICAIKLSRIRAEKRVLQEQQRLLETQKQMEELKAQALKAQMNPHFLFNALNSIQYFITSNDKRSALSYLSLFSKLIRYRLKNFREDTVLLSNEVEVLEWYLKLQKLRYGDKFTYQVERQFPPSTGDVRIPSLVLPFILESAVESSMFDQPAGHMQLSIETTLPQVKLKIIHNLRDPWKENTERWLNYRQNIEPWQQQIARLNVLQEYQVREETAFLKGKNDQIVGVEINLTLPVIEAI